MYIMCTCICTIVIIISVLYNIVWMKSQVVLNILYSSIDECLLSNDLVMDAIVLIWDGCGPLYNTVLSHDIINKPLLTTSRKVIINKHLIT